MGNQDLAAIWYFESSLAKTDQPPLLQRNPPQTLKWSNVILQRENDAFGDLAPFMESFFFYGNTFCALRSACDV